MKGKTGIIVAIVIVVAGVVVGLVIWQPWSSKKSGSGGETKGKTITVDSGKIPSTVTARVGDTIKVVLKGNPTTGYVWTACPLDVGVVKQEGEPTVASPGGDAMGAPADTKIAFKAEKAGETAIVFAYARPSETDVPPDSSYTLFVSVSAGPREQRMNAADDYTAEVAELHVGDTLRVVVRHVPEQDAEGWVPLVLPKMLGSAGKPTYSASNGGTLTGDLMTLSPGSGTLVFADDWAEAPPQETFAVPVVVKQAAQPATIQANQKNDGDKIEMKTGETLQLSLPGQPSTAWSWRFAAYDEKLLKPAGEPVFKPDSEAIGAKGKMVYAFSALGVGSVTLQATYKAAGAAEASPSTEKTFSLKVQIAKGSEPRTVKVVCDRPAPTVFLKKGGSVVVALPGSSAKSWTPQATSRVVSQGKPVCKNTDAGGEVQVTYTGKADGTVTPLLLSNPAAQMPREAFAFTVAVAGGRLPTTVNAIEKKVAETVELAKGDTLDVTLPGNPSSGYMWTTQPFAQAGVLEETGQPTFADTAHPDDPAMGDPGTVTMHYEAAGSGVVQLLLAYESAGTKGAPGGYWSTWVVVK